MILGPHFQKEVGLSGPTLKSVLQIVEFHPPSTPHWAQETRLPVLKAVGLFHTLEEEKFQHAYLEDYLYVSGLLLV